MSRVSAALAAIGVLVFSLALTIPTQTAARTALEPGSMSSASVDGSSAQSVPAQLAMLPATPTDERGRGRAPQRTHEDERCLDEPQACTAPTWASEEESASRSSRVTTSDGHDEPKARTAAPVAVLAFTSAPPLRAPASAPAAVPAAGTAGTVIASWYGPGFYGNRTACGQLYTPVIIGVAHKTLPCGTMLELEFRGRVVIVPVIDRGPFIAGRTLDLSNATRAALACTDLCPVRMQVRR